MEGIQNTSIVPHNLCWNYCPAEILGLIFKKLDGEELASCYQVSERWRDIVDYIAQRDSLWEELAPMLMKNRGVTYEKKSRLSWREMYLNSCLWADVADAQIHCTQVYTIDALNMHVYKDNLIIVTQKNVLYYNLASFELERFLPVKCVDFNESDDIVVKVTADISMSNILVYGKCTPSDFQFTDPNVLPMKMQAYTLEGDSCYVIGRLNIIWLFSSLCGETKFRCLGRYYDSKNTISALHLWHGQLFALTNYGDILQIDRYNNGFKKLFRFKTPQMITGAIPVMFNNYCAVVTAPEDNKKFSILKHKSIKGNAILVQCPDLTCAKQHGHVLLLGYEDGRVEIAIPKKLYATGKPELSFSIKDNLYYKGEKPAILNLDVHEVLGAHILLVGTLFNTYQIRVSHPD